MNTRVGSGRSAFYVVCCAVAIFLPLAGFWHTYFGPVVQGLPLRPVVQTWVIPFHAAFYTGWLFAVLAQVILVWRGRTDLHRKFGVYLATYGAFGVLVGMFAVFWMALRRISLGGNVEEEAIFFFLGFMDMVMFSGYLLAGVLLRNRLETHKRLMMLANATIMLIGYGRLADHLTPTAWLDIRPLATLIYGLPIWLVIAYDTIKYRRLHVVYLIGAVLFAVKVNQDLVMHTAAWRKIGHALLGIFLP